MNEAREKLEAIIFRICDDNGIYRPRTYKKRARKDYPAFAKSRKHPAKKIRAAIRKQLNYVKRDLICVDSYVHQNCSLTEKEKECHPANYSEVQSADCFMEISLSNNGTGTFELAVTAN